MGQSGGGADGRALTVAQAAGAQTTQDAGEKVGLVEMGGGGGGGGADGKEVRGGHVHGVRIRREEGIGGGGGGEGGEAASARGSTWGEDGGRGGREVREWGRGIGRVEYAIGERGCEGGCVWGVSAGRVLRGSW